MKEKTILSAIALTSAMSLVGVVGALLATNPTAVGPVGVTLWFVGVLIALQTSLTLGLYLINFHKHQTQGPIRRLSVVWRQALLAALGLTIFLALSSLRQLGPRDVVLISAVLVLVEFYFRNRK